MNGKKVILAAFVVLALVLFFPAALAIGYLPFYFLIGRLGPFRVLALVELRWPRTGNPRR